MRWFKDQMKLYIGPLAESQVDLLKAQLPIEPSGVACKAGNGKVTFYLTMPYSVKNADLLNQMKKQKVLS